MIEYSIFYFFLNISFFPHLKKNKLFLSYSFRVAVKKLDITISPKVLVYDFSQGCFCPPWGVYYCEAQRVLYFVFHEVPIIAKWLQELCTIFVVSHSYTCTDMAIEPTNPGSLGPSKIL